MVADEEPLLVFGRPSLEDSEIEEIAACLASGWIGTGPRVEAFERACERHAARRIEVEQDQVVLGDVASSGVTLVSHSSSRISGWPTLKGRYHPVWFLARLVRLAKARAEQFACNRVKCQRWRSGDRL